jgi:hypothetical protein
MAESHTVEEIRRLRRALEASIHILHFAEESIQSPDARERVRDGRHQAQREYDRNRLHYDANVDVDI